MTKRTAAIATRTGADTSASNCINTNDFKSISITGTTHRLAYDQMNGNTSNNEDHEDINGVNSSSVSTPNSHNVNTLNSSSSCSSLQAPSVSAVWAYFEKDSLGNSVCKFCNRVVKGHHSSNLLSHLRTAGRIDPAHQQANLICEEHRESKRHIKRQKLTVAMGHSMGSVADAVTLAGLPGQNPYGYRRDTNMSPASFFQQASVAAAAASLSLEQREALAAATQNGGALLFAGNTNTPYPLSQDQLSQELALFILLENLPLDFCSHSGLHYFIQQLTGERNITFPTEDMLRKSISILHESMMLTAKMLIARARAICISVDLWEYSENPIGQEAFLAISIHFSINFRDLYVLVHCSPLSKDQPREVSAEALHDTVSSLIERVGLRNKVIAYMESSRLQKRKMTIARPYEHVQPLISGCGTFNSFLSLSHLDDRNPSNGDSNSIQTSIFVSASRSIETCLSRAILSDSFGAELLAIESFVHQMSNKYAVENQIYKQSPEGFNYKSILESSEYDASTRLSWFYTFLNQFQAQLPMMEQVASAFSIERLPRYPTEWIAMYLKKMRPFQRYLEALHGEKNLATGSDKEFYKHGLSSISTIGAALIAYAEKQAADEGKRDGSDTLQWAVFFRKLEAKLRVEFGKLPHICYAATLLDPRYKDREYCYVTAKMNVESGQKYLRAICGLAPRSETSFHSSKHAENLKHVEFSGMSESLSKTESENGHHDDDDDLLSHLPSTTSERESMDDENDYIAAYEKEFVAYMELPVAERNVDPLQWWRQNQIRYPILASYAEILLSLPATATLSYKEQNDIDKIFIRAQSWNPKRDLTSSDIMEAFLFFQKNKAYALEWFGASNHFSVHNGASNNSNSGTNVHRHDHDNSLTSSSHSSTGILDLENANNSTFKNIENV